MNVAVDRASLDYVRLYADTHFKLRVDAVGQLLSVGLEELGGGLERLEVFVVADLSVTYGHEVSHDAHKACIITIYHLVRQAESCVLEK